MPSFRGLAFEARVFLIFQYTFQYTIECAKVFQATPTGQLIAEFDPMRRRVLGSTSVWSSLFVFFSRTEISVKCIRKAMHAGACECLKDLVKTPVSVLPDEMPFNSPKVSI